MTTLFTIIALGCVAYRIKKRLFTRAEGVLLAIWLGHFCFELAVMLGELCVWRFEARFFRPADFLTWGWLAWGVIELVRRVSWTRHVFAAALGLIVLYDGILLVRAQIPLGRRNAYLAACDWAAEKIRADWKGPQRDDEFVFILGEYRLPFRPVVDCHTARVPYLVGGRSNGVDDGAEESERIRKLDKPDYWIQDIRQDDPPQGADWELVDTFTRGKYEFPLYRRKR